MQRRLFLKNTGLALAVPPFYRSFRHFAPQKLALIGSGWWGNNILTEAIAAGNNQVVGLCDPDERALQKTAQRVKDLTGAQPKLFKDYRECLKNARPDVVIVATPDHWHALPAIAAIEQGAHVYLEKPIGHTIDEGKAILKAARAQNRVVQVGTHRRMSAHNQSANAFLKSGKAGRISMVKCFVNYNWGTGTPAAPVDIPRELDWDMWCGPAPLRPYTPGIHPRGFRQHLDFANGMIGDWGIHWFDQALWWAEEQYPRRVFSTTARHVRQDSTDAPDTQLAVYEFETFTMYWEHKLAANNNHEKSNVGCYFYGTEGTFHLGWLDGWTFYPNDPKSPPLHEPAKLNAPDEQNIRELWADFQQAIDQKRRPACDIEKGHLATNLSLLGMLSARLGRSIDWNGEQVPNDPEANALLRRAYRGEWKYPS